MESKRPEFIRGKSYDAMSTASLYALLETEMDETRDSIDVEKINSILAVLNERTPHEPVDVDAAWDSFVRDYYTGDPLYPEQEEASSSSPESTTKQSEIQNKNQSSEKHSRKKRPVRLFLIAAVVVIALGAITVSATNVWNAILSWTSETLGLSFGSADAPAAELNPELGPLSDALLEDGITTALLPRYLPDGYTQSELYTDDHSYIAAYEKEDQEIFIQIHMMELGDRIQYEHDSNTPEAYIVGDVCYTISSNNGVYTAVWENNGYVCSIEHVPSRQELVKMIDSIYMTEETS